MPQKAGDTAVDAMQNAIRTLSSPTALRITDIRVATVRATGLNPILKIETNQGGPSDERNRERVGFLGHHVR